MGSALPSLGLPSRADVYGRALEGLVQVNGLILEKNPDLPPLYAAGVRWKNRPHTNWRRADMIARDGWGDCEGISAWRAAELRAGRGVYGECDPLARVNCYHTGRKKYHAIVMRGDDTIEDPSVMCGMPVRPGRMPATRDQMNYLNAMWPPEAPTLAPASVVIGWADDDDPSIKTDFLSTPDGATQAQIKIPFADGTALVAKTQATLDRANAMAAGANLLADTAATLVKNPIMLAKLNPYTAAAVMLYTQPEVRKSLGALATNAGGLVSKGISAAASGANFLRRLF